jgi:hypothetical protein
MRSLNFDGNFQLGNQACIPRKSLHSACKAAPPPVFRTTTFIPAYPCRYPRRGEPNKFPHAIATNDICIRHLSCLKSVKPPLSFPLLKHPVSPHCQRFLVSVKLVQFQLIQFIFSDTCHLTNCYKDPRLPPSFSIVV